MRRVRAVGGLRLPLALVALLAALLVAADRPAGHATGGQNQHAVVALASSAVAQASAAQPRPVDRLPLTGPVAFVLVVGAGLLLVRHDVPHVRARPASAGRPVRAPPASPRGRPFTY